MPKEWTIAPADGVKTGQIVRPLGSVGCYVPGGRYPLPSTLLMTADSGAGGGGGADCGVLAEACEGDDGCGMAGRRDGVLSRGRGAGDCGDGLWDGDDCAGRQDRWAGKSICDCGEDNCLERVWDRYACWAYGDCASPARLAMRRGLRRIWSRRRSMILRLWRC